MIKNTACLVVWLRMGHVSIATIYIHMVISRLLYVTFLFNCDNPIYSFCIGGYTFVGACPVPINLLCSVHVFCSLMIGLPSLYFSV